MPLSCSVLLLCPLSTGSKFSSAPYLYSALPLALPIYQAECIYSGSKGGTNFLPGPGRRKWLMEKVFKQQEAPDQ